MGFLPTQRASLLTVSQVVWVLSDEVVGVVSLRQLAGVADVLGKELPRIEMSSRTVTHSAPRSCLLAT